MLLGTMVQYVNLCPFKVHIVLEERTVSSPSRGHFAHCIICYHMSVSVLTDLVMVS